MTPWTLMSIIRRAVASSSSTNDPIGMIPALLISTSSGPSRSETWSRKRANESRSVTSSASPTASVPNCAAASSASGLSRSPIATLAPLAAIAFAVSLPIPRAPPVIATTFPSRDRASLAINSSS
jgi:hypothetical protein